jgi:small subunit ribosomal protein S21e
LSAKDHASIQINIAKLDAHGVYTGEFEPIAISGYLRGKAESDAAIN